MVESRTLKGRFNTDYISHMPNKPYPLRDEYGNIIGTSSIDKDGNITMEVPKEYAPLLNQRIGISIEGNVDYGINGAILESHMNNGIRVIDKARLDSVSIVGMRKR